MRVNECMGRSKNLAMLVFRRILAGAFQTSPTAIDCSWRHQWEHYAEI